MMDDNNQRMLHTLRTVFGYDAFRGQQQEIIDHVISGGDAFVLMPTGGGKSLCFQIPALLRPGVAIVISPLIALMQDQVSALREAGVNAAFLNSTLSLDQARETEEALLNGTLDLIYIAPERLLTERTLDLLSRAKLALFAIDEAHCVSQWGHDFRAEYLGLNILHEKFPSVPRLALTATADEVTREEIRQRLKLEDARLFVAGFDRPNIRYHVQIKQNYRQQLKRFLAENHPQDSGIVYCLSRRKTEETAQWLCEEGYNALPYHAGLSPDVRQQNQQRFQRDEGVIIVATIAFGMGIDKPDVRFVAHIDIPKSMEAYYQETGRAGRDGLPANAWMLYGLGDVTFMRQLLAQSEADAAHKRIELQKFNTLLGYCETANCRRQILLKYFGDTMHEACGNCDTCLEPVESWDGSLAARKALYCVYQTGQLFGVNYLVDILTGKMNERIEQRNHHKLSAFGKGSEVDAKEWPSIFRQLIALGLLTVDMQGHGSVILTADGEALLRDSRNVLLRKDPLPRSKNEKKAKQRKDRINLPLFNTPDQLLFDELRTLRLNLAREAGVPPYVIFHDSVLRELVARRPQNEEEFGNISGIGQNKVTRYASKFLPIIRQHGISESHHENVEENPIPDTDSTLGKTIEMYRQGMSPENIANERSLSINTIYGHIACAIEQQIISLQDVLDLDDSEISHITMVINNLPDKKQSKLTTIADALNRKYDYYIIRCIIADMD